MLDYPKRIKFRGEFTLAPASSINPPAANPADGVNATPAGVKIFGDQWAGEHSGPTVYVLQANSTVERELLHTYVTQMRPLHDETHGKHILSWISTEIDDGKILHDGLLEALSPSRELFLVPIGVAWLSKNKKKGKRARLIELLFQQRTLKNEKRQRNILAKHPERCAIVIGQPGPKSGLTTRFEHTELVTGDNGKFADFVARQAALTIERDARKISGAAIKYPRFVAQAIWARSDFQNRLKELAEETGRPALDIETEAKACLEEIIPQIRPFYVSLSNLITGFARRLGYDKDIVYDRKHIAKIREIALTKPTALLFTHKSHIDGMAMIDATRGESFPLVHMVGGNNMAFLGIGYIFRRAGTIFIRRSTKDSPVYKAVLRHYIAYLLEKRFPVAWALEGTRSRNGKLMPPRFGILKYVLEAAAKNAATDLHIIPVSIYYDLISEIDDYAHEQTGGVKRKESLMWFAGYLQGLRKKLGRLSMSFGVPVVVDTSGGEYAAGPANASDTASVNLQKIGFEASVSANNATPMTASAVFATILTAAAPQALTEPEVIKEFTAIMRWAYARKIPMADDLKTRDIARIKFVAGALIDAGVISRYDEGPDPVFAVAPDQHFAASYYRNSIIHFFVNKAFIELALLKASEAHDGDALSTFWAEIMRLRDIFKFEFFYPSADTHKSQIADELARVDAQWETSIGLGKAYTLLTAMTPLFSHAVLRPFAEAYAVVSDVVLGLKAGDDDSEKTIAAACLRLGKQAYLRRQISSQESIGKLMFCNGYQLAGNRSLLAGEGDITGPRVAFARELKDLTRRIRLIDAICAQARANNEHGLHGIAGGKTAPGKNQSVGIKTA